MPGWVLWVARTGDVTSRESRARAVIGRHRFEIFSRLLSARNSYLHSWTRVRPEV